MKMYSNMYYTGGLSADRFCIFNSSCDLCDKISKLLQSLFFSVVVFKDLKLFRIGDKKFELFNDLVFLKNASVEIPSPFCLTVLSLKNFFDALNNNIFQFYLYTINILIRC